VDDPILGGDERHHAGRFALIDKLLHARRYGRKTIRLLRDNEQRRQHRNGYDPHAPSIKW